MKYKNYIIAAMYNHKPLRFEITNNGKTIKIESGVELIGELSIEQMSEIKSWFQDNLNTNRKDITMDSKFKHGDSVELNFGEKSMIKNCIVDGVSFSEGKVWYDVLVQVNLPHQQTRLEKVDSAMVRSAHNTGDACGTALPSSWQDTQIVEIGKMLTATTFQDSARLRALSRDLKAIADQTN